jgi:hypothetical protein
MTKPQRDAAVFTRRLMVALMIVAFVAGSISAIYAELLASVCFNATGTALFLWARELTTQIMGD